MSHPLIPAVIELVRQAGAATLPHWRADVTVNEKADASPVTAADLAAHHILNDGLLALAPHIPVLSEEAADIALSERAQWSPLVAGRPAGRHQGIYRRQRGVHRQRGADRARAAWCLAWSAFRPPACAITAALAWVPGAPSAARCAGARSVCAVAPQEAFTLVASRRHSSPAQEALLAGLSERFGDLQLASVGSSLKFCLLAEGNADCYPRLAPTSQWDTAAAQGVLEGAGGEVLTLQGRGADL